MHGGRAGDPGGMEGEGGVLRGIQIHTLDRRRPSSNRVSGASCTKYCRWLRQSLRVSMLKLAESRPGANHGAFAAGHRREVWVGDGVSTLRAATFLPSFFLSNQVNSIIAKLCVGMKSRIDGESWAETFHGASAGFA